MIGRNVDREARYGGGIVGLVGLGFVAISGQHLRTEFESLVVAVLGAGLPLLLAGATVLGGAMVARSDLTREQIVELLAWWVLGIAVTALMGIVVVVYQASHDVPIADSFYVVANNAMAGSVGGLLVGYFYTSARHRAEQLAAERERLATEHERLEVLNRVVRHDIRNDMTVVLTWLELLEDHVDEEGRDALDRAQTASDHVVELTEVARDYVRVVVDESDVDRHPVALAELLENELRTRREAYPGAEFLIDGEVPTVSVLANEMLSSVFRNLLNNAVQHSDADTPRVEVSVELADEQVVVRVADNGPGIPEAERTAMFGTDDRSLEESSSGIGLYLVQTLVSEYGGTVRLADNEPRGSVFEVTLPRA